MSEPSDLLPSPAREAPIPIEPPGRVQTPALDRRPEQVSTESRDGATSSRPDEPARNAASARDAGSPGQTGAANDDAPAIGAGDDRSPARAFVPQPPALIAQEGGAEESPRLDDLAALQAEQPPAGRPADAGVVAPEAAASVAVGVIRMDPLDLSLPPDLGAWVFRPSAEPAGLRWSGPITRQNEAVSGVFVLECRLANASSVASACCGMRSNVLSRSGPPCIRSTLPLPRPSALRSWRRAAGWKGSAFPPSGR
ncbi:hypothetical protein QWZ10_10650 [Paracoccus cavernae]|uniref:Uncharacterized protein n=1 Tax=Paracoccus cavernae TaxID=1571207 RepID=A0ABT8D5X5_9RHOB|nr:hypothetical protein [Paracoccus cavernae]